MERDTKEDGRYLKYILTFKLEGVIQTPLNIVNFVRIRILFQRVRLFPILPFDKDLVLLKSEEIF